LNPKEKESEQTDSREARRRLRVIQLGFWQDKGEEIRNPDSKRDLRNIRAGGMWNVEAKRHVEQREEGMEDQG